MKIAIDASSCAMPQSTGVGRYIRCLIRALAALDYENHYVVCYRLSKLTKRRYFLKLDGRNFRTRLFHEPFAPFLWRGLDVFHGPDARLPNVNSVPMVATLLDVFASVSDAYADETFRAMKTRRYQELAERAARIIAISENTKREFLEHHTVADGVVRVVPLGVSPEFRPHTPEAEAAAAAKYGLDRDYLLYVGAITTRKNIRRLAAAFSKVVQDKDLLLVLAGRPGYGADAELAAIEELGLQDRVRSLGYVDDADLPVLYSGAKLLVFPSLHEGFGLPLLEAMASGTPCVTSNVTSPPEVVGDAALLVDPLDADAIADAILTLLRDEALYAGLSQRGLDRAKLFPWQRTARETLAVYREVCQTR
ncbi:glycosyltransferase family 4 protein [Planctomycetota bacterium]